MTRLAFAFLWPSVGAGRFEACPARGAERCPDPGDAGLALRTSQPYGWCHRRDTVHVPGRGAGERSAARGVTVRGAGCLCKQQTGLLGSGLCVRASFAFPF